MSSQYDFKKEWERTKEQLVKFSKEAATAAKKSEAEFIKLSQKGKEEIVKLSHKGKLHMDAAALTLKKEKLYYLVGKAYVNLKDPSNVSKELSELMAELRAIEKAARLLHRKINAKPQK